MSIACKQNKLAFALTQSVTNYVLGSFDVTYTDGLPLNRAAIWRVTFDASSSAIDLTFTFEIMAKFGGTWAYLEAVVVPAGTVRTFERTHHGWALRISTNPGAVNVTVSTEFQGTTS